PPWVVLGGLALAQYEVVAVDDQADAPIEHVQPLVSLVAVEHGVCEIDGDADPVDARAGGALGAYRLPCLAVAAAGTIVVLALPRVGREQLVDRNVHRSRQYGDVRERQSPGAGFQPADGRGSQ